MVTEELNSSKVKEIKTKQKPTKMEKQDRKWFFIFIAPWLLGFLILTLIPIIASIFFSFTDWDLFNKANFIGLDNYKKLFFDDPIFKKVLMNTIKYALMSVPITMILSLGMAYLLNFKIKGMRIFRTIFYLPSLVPVVASSLVFMRLLAPDGLINKFLAIFGVQGPSWLLDKNWVLVSFVFIAIWGVGANMVLLLAGMQGIPEELYEAAMLDGANRFKTFRHVTIPQLTPIILFNLIMGVIGALQSFSQVYIMTAGGPDNASNMIVPYLFENGFRYFRMGYASAIAWVLFVIVIILSLVVFKSSSLWVFYEGEVKK